MDAEAGRSDAGGSTGHGGEPRGERGVPLPDHPSAASTVREVNGVELHVVVAGDPSDPPVVLLHGFPEFWYGWRDYVGPLADEGYRVLVPDQRGYNRSDKPDGVRAYRQTELSRDVVELVESEGHDSARVVGHDWGGGVAWDLALRHPDLVDRLGICNSPHPVAYEATLKSSLAQLRKSWYVMFFQVPRIPEWAVQRNDFATWVDSMRGGAEPGTFTDADVECYRRAWNRPGAPSAMIHWYRAAARHSEDPPRERVGVPTLVCWGENDPWLVPELAERSVGYCDDGRLERFPDASHWLIHERTDEVLGHLLDHFDG